jgi:mRNA-degrading endonuclease RelE of RelBE toxin-antitoxin system
MYSALINRDAQKYVDSLTEKSRRLVKKKLEMLKDNLMCVRLSIYLGPGKQNQKKRKDYHTKSILWTQINAD